MLCVRFRVRYRNCRGREQSWTWRLFHRRKNCLRTSFQVVAIGIGSVAGNGRKCNWSYSHRRYEPVSAFSEGLNKPGIFGGV